ADSSPCASPRRSRSTSSVFRDALQRSAAGGSLPGGVVAFRRLSRMPGLLSCRHRSRDGVQRNRVRFNLIDQGSSLAGEHPSAVGRSRHTLARPKDAHVITKRDGRGLGAAADLGEACQLGSACPQLLWRAIDRVPGGPELDGAAERGLLCPPTQIGGYGFCSGLGSKTSPLN